MTSSLYVYYKVRLELASSLRETIHTMQARLRSGMPGLAAGLWCRADEPGGLHATWMEVYQFNGHADDRAWAALADAMAPMLAQLSDRWPDGIEGGRHEERFDLMAPISTGYRGLPCA